jgi:hypothetical protein
MDSFTATIINEIKELSGIDITASLRTGLIRPGDATRWLVREKYYRLAKTGRTYTDIKLELSGLYGISISSIEKLIYRK